MLTSTLSPLTAPTLTGWLSLQVSQVLVLFSVECSNQNDPDLDYYDVGNVAKLNIDTTKSFHAKDFITGMLPYHSAKLNLSINNVGVRAKAQ